MLCGLDPRICYICNVIRKYIFCLMKQSISCLLCKKVLYAYDFRMSYNKLLIWLLSTSTSLLSQHVDTTNYSYIYQILINYLMPINETKNVGLLKVIFLM